MTIYRVKVPHKLIQKNPFQARTEYGDIDELAMRIYGARFTYPDTLGLMQVPQGRVVADDGKLLPIEPLWEELEAGRTLEEFGAFVQLAFGHRRQKAMALLFHNKGCADYIEMPVILRDFTDDEMLDAVWSENKERRDLSEVEEAELMQLAIKEAGLTHAKLAKRWNVSRATVSNQLRLLKLPEGIKLANRRGEMSSRQCLALLPIHELKKKIDLLPQDIQKEIKWNKSRASGKPTIYSWEAPVHPNYFISHCAENPNAFTSVEIRSYLDLLKGHITDTISPKWSGEAFHEKGKVTNATCKGCRHLFQSKYCTRTPCSDYRKVLWGKALAKQVAEAYDVEYVECINGYELERMSKERHLVELFLDKEADPDLRSNIVVSFDDSEYLPRPFGDNYPRDVYVDLDNGEPNQLGIVLGLKGNQGDFNQYADNKVEEAYKEAESQKPPKSPEVLMLEQWREFGNDELKATKEAITAYLNVLFTRLFEDEPDILIVLASIIGKGMITPNNNTQEGLVDLLTQSVEEIGFKAYSYYTGEAQRVYEKFQTAIARTDSLTVEMLFPTEGDIERGKRQAKRALGLWYQHRNTHYEQKEKAQATKPIVWKALTVIRVLVKQNESDAELQQLSEWLMIAYEEIEEYV